MSSSVQGQGKAMPELIVRAEDVHREYRVGGHIVRALRGVNFHVHAGRFVLVRGRSGSGKTTLLNALGALDHPTRGRIWVVGEEITALTESERTRFRRTQVGFVFQSFALLPTLSAEENVDVMLRLAGVRAWARKQRARECLEMVGLSEHARHRPYELSGGQQQRVAIARAIALNPPLILADEPTGELDSSTAAEIYALFRRLVKEQGTTVILASHDPVAVSFADEVYMLEDGVLFSDAPHVTENLPPD